MRLRLAAALLLAGAAAASGEQAVITSQNAGAVSFVDPESGAVTATLALPGKPAAVAVDPSTGQAYVVAVETALLHVLSPAGVELRRIPLPGAPFGVAVNPATHHVYVSDWQGAEIHEVDPERGAVLRSFATGAAPSGIAVSVDGALIVTADRDANRISLIDAASGAAQSVAVGEHPFGITLHGGRAFAVNVLSDDVTVVDLASRRVTASIPVGPHPYALAFAAGRGFVTNQYGESLTVFDATSLEVLATIPVGEYPEGIAATADGRRVLVANWFSDSLTILDASSLEILAEVGMPEGPRAFGSFIGPSPAPPAAAPAQAAR
ncbi:MAG: MxaE-like protein [Cereibacter sp.]|nr:MxaE-like protein [Cereibacter sp.]